MVTMGITKITCQLCGAAEEVKNEDLEVLREYRCKNPDCKCRMTDHQFANMKAGYYLGLAIKHTEAFGNATKYFKYEIDINPEYTPDWAVSAENGNQQGG